MSEGIAVRRAKREDIPGIAALLHEATPNKDPVSEADVMEWLFSKGLWVATCHGALSNSAEATVVGVAAWQAENLLSVTDLFCVSPARLRANAGGMLLEAIEAEANVLMCEANVVLLPKGTPKAILAFFEQQGYEPREFRTLHRIWREVLSEFVFGNDQQLLVKQLRERMIMVPI
jgi:N-acetylglutamate synthase-like GNAT family acetyltransferase